MSACPVCGKRMKSAQGLADHQRSMGHFAAAETVIEEERIPDKEATRVSSSLTPSQNTRAEPVRPVESPARTPSPARAAAVDMPTAHTPVAAAHSTSNRPAAAVVVASPVHTPVVVAAEPPVVDNDSWAPLSLADELAIGESAVSLEKLALEERRVRQAIIGEANVLPSRSPVRHASPIGGAPFVSAVVVDAVGTSLDALRCSQCTASIAFDQVANHQCPCAPPPIKVDACTLC